MKKTTKQPKRLLLSSQTVRKLQSLSDADLGAVAGGIKPCPYSVVKPPCDVSLA